MLRLHPELQKEICSVIVGMFEMIEPDQLFAQAYAKYPNRGEKERILMYAEDVICDKLGISRVYNGGSLAATLSRIA